VTKSKITVLGLLGLLLAAVILTASCLPLASTSTGTSGTTATPSFFDQYGIIFFLIAIFGLMYLLMIRPQRKRQKEMQKMVEELKRGDEVITNSGIYGTIDSVEETSFVLKLEDGARMRVVKNAVAGKKPEVQ
jgi:preprotein translocase subunit YajC